MVMDSPIGNPQTLGARPTEHVVERDDELAAVLGQLLGPGDRVVLAEPVDPVVTAAILQTGARYVDCGRDSGWRIDRGGLDLLLADPRVRLVFLGAPNWPTATTPDDAVVASVRAAGKPVLVDRRHAGQRWEWIRVPGVPSVEIAQRAAHEAVVGSAAWTWRDAVVVRADAPAAVRARIC